MSALLFRVEMHLALPSAVREALLSNLIPVVLLLACYKEAAVAATKGTWPVSILS